MEGEKNKLENLLKNNLMKRKERILAELQEDSEEDRKNKLDMLKSELESVNTRINGDVARFKGTNILRFIYSERKRTQKQIFTAPRGSFGKVMFSEAFVCPQGSLSRGVSVTETPPRYGGRAGGTHHTGMHSCFL